MITVTYKDAKGNWVEDGSEHLLLDQAKAHAVAEGYAEYKAHRDGMQMAHLFNADAKPKPAPKPEPTAEPEVEDWELESDSDDE